MITLKSAREIEARIGQGIFLLAFTLVYGLLKPGVDMWEVEEYVVCRRCKEENVLPLQIGLREALCGLPICDMLWP